MFGYIKPYTPTLTVAQQAFYKSIYCGLCHTTGQRTCHSARLRLSYDFVFLSLVRLAVTGTSVVEWRRRCVAHPFSKRYTVASNDTLSYAASAAGVLQYYAAADHIADSRGMPRLAARAAAVGTRRAARRAKDAVDTDAVKRSLAELHALEKDREPMADAAAEPFGTLLGSVFAHGLSGAPARIAREIGYHCGRWIYLIDAADDYDGDRKAGRYNPFLCGGELTEETRQTLYRAMLLCCEEMQRAAELIPFGERTLTRALLFNIICEGMPMQARRIVLRETPDPAATVLPQGADIERFTDRMTGEKTV